MNSPCLYIWSDSTASEKAVPRLIRLEEMADDRRPNVECPPFPHDQARIFLTFAFTCLPCTVFDEITALLAARLPTDRPATSEDIARAVDSIISHP